MARSRMTIGDGAPPPVGEEPRARGSRGRQKRTTGMAPTRCLLTGRRYRAEPGGGVAEREAAERGDVSLERVPVEADDGVIEGEPTERDRAVTDGQLGADGRSGTRRKRTIIVMPAYNAARTIERMFADLPAGCYDEVIVVDDGSGDATVEIARRLPATVICRERNGGYGANQKTCYAAALARGADYVVMLHPDYQYDARVIPAAIGLIELGICDVILGNRIRTRAEALAGGMPRVKYLANRGLTIIENVLTGQNLGEWHSGFRVYTRRVLETVPFLANSDDFVFDSQFLVQCVHFGFKVGDIPVPVRYFDEASSINLRRSAVYAVQTMWTLALWFGHRWGIRRERLFAGEGRR